MIRIGVIGAGRHSRLEHGPALAQYARQHPDAIECTAICDLDADRAARYAAEFGFERTYTSVERMLDAETLDGLVAVTPMEVTRSLVGELLTQRIPLLLEKPPGRTSAETRALLEIAGRHDAPHMVSFNRRFAPGVVRARAWLREHAADRSPRLVVARMLRHARREPHFITATSIHAIDTVLSLLGEPTRVVSRRDNIGRGQTCEASVAFHSGARAILLITPDVGTLEETYEGYGDEYTIQIDAMNRPGLEIFRRNDLVLSWRVAPNCPTAGRTGTLGETEAFVEAVRGQGAYWPTLTDALWTMKVAEAAQRGGETVLSQA